jgi:hypothetical protein
MGVAPNTSERVSSIPPGVFGGNVDNWRFGPGATIHYPVFTEGARFYVGDPHFAQGDGEICGTAIEASLDVRLRLSLAPEVPVTAPLLDTGTHWYTHGFGEGLDEAMAMAAEQMLRLLVDTADSRWTRPTRWRRWPSTSASPRWSTVRSGATPRCRTTSCGTDPTPNQQDPNDATQPARTGTAA